MKILTPEWTTLNSLRSQVGGGRRGHVRASPDHPGGGVAHCGVLGLDELLVVVDAAVDLVVLFARQLLSRGESPPDFLHRNSDQLVTWLMTRRFKFVPPGSSGFSQRWPGRPCPAPCPAHTWPWHPCPLDPLVSEV